VESVVNDAIVKALRLLGFNRAIGFGVLTRAWSLIAGPVTILVIATRMTREQQGFYYTFSSLLALQMFFELGLMSVIAQFASHEFAYLDWGELGKVEGDPVCRGRFIALLCKSVKWFGVVSVLMVFFLIPLGLIFLHQEQKNLVDFAWRLPWVLAVIGTAANLLVVPFLAVIMGSGDVATVNQREMLGAIVGSCCSWLVICLHGGLYAAFAVNCGNAIVAWSYLFRRKPELLRLVWWGVFGAGRQLAKAGGIGWWREIWPMQWKIALSWVSGYFIFQLFNPVLFHYHGSIVAGQMGITLSAANALLGASFAWLNAKSPEFGKCVATKDWARLDEIFSRVFLQSIVIVVVGALAGWGVIYFIQSNYLIGLRFIPASHAAFLLAAVSVQIPIFGFATYLRAHKKEPFLLISLVSALTQGFITWYAGKHYSTYGVCIGYFAVTVAVSLPASYIVWKKCKYKWHSS
jgi:O-antigen/teichoic acid export membrane protein